MGFYFLNLQCFASKNKINGELRYEEIPLSSMVTERRLNLVMKLNVINIVDSTKCTTTFALWLSPIVMFVLSDRHVE